MSTTLSNRSRPVISRYAEGVCEAPLISFAASEYRVSLISVDLPEPDTPVIAVNRPDGISRSTFLRLLPRAPFSLSISLRLGTWRFAGTSIRFLPDRYCPVSERGAFRMSASLPCATTSPPCTPAPGPMSTTWSARRIASSSCSTTITVLPRSRRRVRVPSRRSLSRWCRPMLGSSSTYITPTRPAPICEARRMRWASPPDRLSALRSRVR